MLIYPPRRFSRLLKSHCDPGTSKTSADRPGASAPIAAPATLTQYPGKPAALMLVCVTKLLPAAFSIVT
jgi:hypothetical protein